MFEEEEDTKHQSASTLSARMMHFIIEFTFAVGPSIKATKVQEGLLPSFGEIRNKEVVQIERYNNNEEESKGGEEFNQQLRIPIIIIIIMKTIIKVKVMQGP